jgi:hypothetical protein
VAPTTGGRRARSGQADPAESRPPVLRSDGFRTVRLTGDERLSETERAVLHARIAALERRIDQQHRQLDAVVDRYETILSSRSSAVTALSGDAVEIEFQDDSADEPGLLDRFRAVLGGIVP